MQLTILFFDVIILDESYPPRLLVYKARRLRMETGNWALHVRFEEWDVSQRIGRQIQNQANPDAIDANLFLFGLVRLLRLRHYIRQSGRIPNRVSGGT